MSLAVRIANLPYLLEYLLVLSISGTLYLGFLSIYFILSEKYHPLSQTKIEDNVSWAHLLIASLFYLLIAAFIYNFKYSSSSRIQHHEYRFQPGRSIELMQKKRKKYNSEEGTDSSGGSAITAFKMIKSLSRLCFFIGAVKLAQYPYDLYQGLDVQYRRKPLDLHERYGGGYVVITGGTDGLGKSFAKRFANMGFNLILISRNEEKLSNVKNELEKEYKVRVETVPFDLSTGDLGKYDGLRSVLGKYDVSVLLNNAAQFNERNVGEFDKLSDIRDQIYTNCLSVTLLTNLILPQLKARTPRSAIINIGSQAAERSSQHNSNIYFATKSFTNSLSESLIAENLDEKIDFTLIKPGLLLTNMIRQYNKNIGEDFASGFLLEDPDYFAERSIRAIGHDSIINGSERSALMNYVLKHFSPLSTYMFNHY